ncbi:hypothetical protein D9757_003836 [Collybiopsis confluens]|uniref:Acetyl-CoA synthetase-like protein n=1 Tax=Collybiopsis confluens TaxID=2823264 RepID=A0A8H5MDM4_9AGAR|nr:hypothetical protein D9757_003836 [Collybiopsis confluens]
MKPGHGQLAVLTSILAAGHVLQASLPFMLPIIRSLPKPRWRKPLHRKASMMSLVQGPVHPPLDTRTLSDYFVQEILHKHSTRPALICPTEKPRAHGGPPSQNLGRTSHLAWDFEELERHIDAAARGLLLMGVQKGDRIAVIMGNNSDADVAHSAYAIIQWAAARIGAILATLNPSYRIHELTETLRLVGVKHLFVVPTLRSSNYLSMLTERFPALANSTPGNIQEPALPDLKNLVVVNNRDEHDLIKPAVDWREVMLWREDTQEAKLVKDIAKSLQKDDVINVQFTSGTTGAPKGVALTHYNLLNNSLNIGRSMRISEQDILCNAPPLFHFLGNLTFWSHGASIVYPSESFDPEAIVNALVNEGCTALHGVPTHFLGVLSEVEKRKHNGENVNLENLRTGVAAGTSVPIELMRKLISEMNLRDLTNAYGMTETSPVSFQTTPSDPLLKRVETVGKIHPHAKAKIIDPQGNIVPVGVPGEVCVSGYLVQKGYWNDDEQTQQVVHKDAEDGTMWMHSGDEGILDEDGYLKIVGRIKDIIIRGGENLFPVQIENALLSANGVREAAVVSVPDEHFGEVVGAWIVRRTGEGSENRLSRSDVRKAVRERMNPQAAPAWVWFLGEDGTQDELPKTASGKIMKHVLRKWSKELAERGVGRVRTQ